MTSNDSNKGLNEEDGSDRKMWTEKYGFGARVLNISVPIFLSFDSSILIRGARTKKPLVLQIMFE